MIQTLYIQAAALALSVISILILRTNIMLADYPVSWFSIVFNVLFLMEFGSLTFFGRSPVMNIFAKVRKNSNLIIRLLKGLNLLTVLFFLFWAAATASRTHASGDTVITLIQVFYLGALATALYINSRFYRDDVGAKFHNLFLITGITYAVSVFMAARLLQGSVIMPWQLLASAMGNIVLAVLAMMVTNPSGRRDA